MKRLLATLTLLVFCAACSPEVDHQVANVIEQKANQENAVAQRLYYEALAESYVAQEAQSKAKATAAWSNAEIAKAETWQSRWSLVVWLEIGGWTLALLAAGWIIISLINMQMRRMQLAYYGQSKNPLILAPDGAVYNPLTEGWSGRELPPGVQSDLIQGFQAMLLAQAQHSPIPAAAKPEVAKASEWHIGPIGRTHTSTPIGPTITVPRVSSPPAKVAEPEAKTQLVFVKTEGDGNSKQVRELNDIQEFIEDGWGNRGLARSAWVSRMMTGTGNKVGRAYYDTTMKTFEQAGLVEKRSDGWVPIVPMEEALDAFGLAHAD